MDTPTMFEHNWSCKGRDQNVEVYSQRVMLTFCIWSAQEPLGQIGPNFDVILFECSSSKIMPDDLT
jgi:hypothetical protein